MAARPDLSRRALLGLLGGGLLVAGCGSTAPEKTGAPSTSGTGLRKIRYGTEHPDQYGVLGLPSGTPRAVAILVHGGYWLEQYGAGLMDPMGEDLRSRGYATWNIEYRRVGGDGGYPQTLSDVAAAFDKVTDLGLPTGVPIVSLGHSAGGQLVVWAASRTAETPGGPARVVPASTVSLSGVLDLTTGAQEGLGGGAVQGLMGTATAADYALADPAELVPARGRVSAVAAEDDEIVPPDQSSVYVRLDKAAGGEADLVKVPGGHFDLIDPASDAWTEILALLPVR